MMAYNVTCDNTTLEVNVAYCYWLLALTYQNYADGKNVAQDSELL